MKIYKKMKKHFLLLPLLFASLSAVHAQRVVTDNFDLLEVHYQTPSLDLTSVAFGDSKADVLQLAGYQLGGEVGSPALPLRIDVIAIPFCDAVEVEVSNAVYDTLQLASSQSLFFPLQRSRSKSDTVRRAPEVNAERYATDAFWGMPLASVEVMGVARDRRLANLTFSPVQVNPVTGQVVVCRSADVVVRYIGSDEQATIDHYNRYHTPAFSAGTLLNKLVSKSVSNTAPLRMVIVAPGTLRCTSMSRFADWKRSQGLLVDLVYTDEAGLTHRDSIANYLLSLYNNATVEAPAPTYLLLVGDNGQIKAFNSKLSNSSYYGLNYDHVTDLYFVTWTSGDNLPDAYQGRISVTDTNILAHIINKTLLYEQYAFKNDDYLAHAVLVAGEDNGTHQTSGWSVDQAWVYCDPTMDYIAKTYINHENGYDTVSYYKNNVDYAPDGVYVTGYCSNTSSASALRDLYYEGVGWINYSAHGNWDRWYKPSFTTGHISSMTNNGKPSFMIGNCCLTNKFDKGECFGEALLRKKNNAGAVAYIGGTNSTLWTEDFYWAVGIRSNISNTMNTSYNASKLGMYDCLFHTHDESLDHYAITAGSIVMAGNMSVNASSSSEKLYYWEIYELMGDPSLLPWMGRASDLETHVERHGEYLRVNAVENAYVAIVDSTDNSLVAAAFTGYEAVATLNIPNSTDLGHTYLSITAQGYKPFHKRFNDVIVGIDAASRDSQLTLAPNPATDRCTVSANGLQRVELLDLTGRTIQTVNMSSVGSQQSTVSFDLAGLQGGIYLVRLFCNDGVTVKKLVVNK